MHEALHPRTGRKVTVHTYLNEFGRLETDHKGPDPRPAALCPFCREPMSPRADKRNSTSGHFAHRPNSGFCPSKEPTGRPYLDLTPRRPDRARSLSLRIQFKASWQRHYRRLESIVPRLHVAEFLSLMSLADRWRIWEYVDLHLGHTPYVLVTLADFSPRTGRRTGGTPNRDYWFRFIYEASFRHIEDIWIRPPNSPKLYCLTYSPPRGAAAPTGRHLLRDDPIDLDATFLTSPFFPVATYVESKVLDWFTANWPDVP